MTTGHAGVAQPQGGCLRGTQTPELLRTPPVYNTPAAKADVRVGYLHERLQAVLRHDQGNAFLLQVGEDVHEDARALLVQIRRRLVEHQQPRDLGDRGRQCNPLLLPARELGKLLAQQGVHPTEGCRAPHPLDRLVRRNAEVL